MGRQGSVRETNAVGSKWTKAVAIKTPVPKCLEMKRKRRGIGRRGNRRARTGNEHAMYHDELVTDFFCMRAYIPNVLNMRMRNSAITCADVL